MLKKWNNVPRSPPLNITHSVVRESRFINKENEKKNNNKKKS
jgi:hypothetical protein